MFLKHDDLVIRNAAACDASLLCNWWNDGRIMAHAGYPNGLGITEQEVLRKEEWQSSVDYELTRSAFSDELHVASPPIR